MSHYIECAAALLVVGWSLALVGFVALCVKYDREQRRPVSVVDRVNIYTREVSR